MASSDTEIANLALAHLNHAKRIGDLTADTTEEAKACRLYYAEVLDQILRDSPWSFATRYATLALVASSPAEVAGEWAYSYRYPSDAIALQRILSGTPTDTPDSEIPYEIASDTQGWLIYTNQAEARIKYTVREKNVSRYPAGFVLAFSLLLASFIAPILTAGDPFKLGDRAHQRYLLEVAKARATMQNEQRRGSEPESQFVRDRS